ncbi:MAG TPA: glycosyltransferase, partial [Marmoricola sp.]|nr:glycosyltransferase [Marmoricola sp.]
MPLFSIITPVYNPPIDALQDTIASVLAQTCTDWEWILVDDWQSLDETTTTLLRSLVPLLPEVGLVLVLAERLEEVPSAPHAQSAPLPTDPVASQPVWTLPALTLEDVQQAAESALGAGR